MPFEGGYPAHPIAPGGPPPGTWGGSGQPFPGYGLPGQPPGTWGGSGQPFPGYGLPGQPPGIWGGSNEPFPGYGLPGRPGGGGPPSVWPGVPAHPIVIPPVKPGDPPTIWPPAGHPAHPIVLPPDPPPTVWPDPPGRPPGGETGSPGHPINLPPAGAGGTQPGFWSMAYFEQFGGWVWVWVPVPTPPSEPPTEAQPKRR